MDRFRADTAGSVIIFTPYTDFILKKEKLIVKAGDNITESILHFLKSLLFNARNV